MHAHSVVGTRLLTTEIDVQRFFEPQAASRYRRAPHGQLRVPQQLHVDGAALPPRG
jgi:hypothetical protein